MKISIIVPLHNKGKYIAQTLHSIQKQTYKEWEAIVVENHSTDNGPEVVRRISSEDSRIRLIKAPPEVAGPGAARNLGIETAEGEWVLFLDADDLLENKYLEHMLAAASDNPDATIVAAPWKSFSDDGNAEPKSYSINEPTGYHNNGKDIIDSALAFACWAVHAAIIKRDWLHGDRIWPTELDRYLGEDTAFWFRVVSGALVAYCTYPGAIYREHTGECRSNYQSDKWFEGCHQAIKSNLAFIELSGALPTSEQKATLVRVYSGLYMKAKLAGDLNVAEKSLDEARNWLDSICNDRQNIVFQMHLRKLCGIPCYEKMKSLLQRSKLNYG